MDRRIGSLLAICFGGWIGCVWWIVATPEAPLAGWRVLIALGAVALPLVGIGVAIVGQRRP